MFVYQRVHNIMYMYVYTLNSCIKLHLLGFVCIAWHEHLKSQFGIPSIFFYVQILMFSGVVFASFTFLRIIRCSVMIWSDLSRVSTLLLDRWRELESFDHWHCGNQCLLCDLWRDQIQASVRMTFPLLSSSLWIIAAVDWVDVYLTLSFISLFYLFASMVFVEHMHTLSPPLARLLHLFLCLSVCLSFCLSVSHSLSPLALCLLTI